LEQKEKALMEIKLDDEILEENKANELEYKRKNNKKKCNSSKRKSEYIVNTKNNLESDINFNNNKIDENIGKKPKKEKTKEKKIKNQIIIKKCSTAALKVYDENIKNWRNSLNLSPKRRKKLMKSNDDIEESPILKDNIENKNNNVKLLGKNYKEIFNEDEKEIINNSKIDSVRIILEELM